MGASVSQTGLSQAEPEEVSALTGFDPSRGRDRREEAAALLPFFTDEWEPLRDVLERSGDRRSASQMVSRARELEGLGLIESRWANAMKVWRKSTGGNDALRRVAEAIRKRFYELVDQPLKNGDDAMLEVARAAIAAWCRRDAQMTPSNSKGR